MSNLQSFDAVVKSSLNAGNPFAHLVNTSLNRIDLPLYFNVHCLHSRVERFDTQRQRIQLFLNACKDF